MSRTFEPPGEDEFVELFLQLAQGRLQRASDAVYRLLEDGSTESVALDFKRELHTLKGEALLLEFEAIADIARRMEEAFAAADQMRATRSPTFWTAMLGGLDLCRSLV